MYLLGILKQGERSPEIKKRGTQNTNMALGQFFLFRYLLLTLVKYFLVPNLRRGGGAQNDYFECGNVRMLRADPLSLSWFDLSTG